MTHPLSAQLSKHLSISTLVLAMFVGCSSTPERLPIAETLAELAGTLSISGHLRTASGQPLAGIDVRLAGSAVADSITDANGSYQFSVLKAGSYSIRPTVANCQFSPDVVNLNNLKTSKTQDFVGSGSGCLPSSHSDAYGACLETPRASRVLVLVYDQYHSSLRRDQGTHGHAVADPVASSHQLVDLFRQTSHGLINYQITDVRFINGEPPEMAPGAGNSADYAAIFQQNDICNLIANQNLSEVWVWGDGSAGLDELAYKVPNDAVPNDAQAENPWFYDLRKKNIPDCGKTIWVMGWNYEVGVDNAVHSYNHRIESILSLMVGQGRWYQPTDLNNPWYKFSLFDLNFPGQAGIGSTHVPANGTAEYDYGNTRSVLSTAADFLNYPQLTGAKAPVDCTQWGCDQLGYQQWYESHIPHVAGTSYAGTCNSWWTYIADFDRRLAPCSGTGCLQPLGGLCNLADECASGTCACGNCVAAGTNPTCLGAAFDPCSSPSQCASGLCGCSGEAGNLLCMPSATYATSCQQPTGGPCWGDSDCASATCGCNGGSMVTCQALGQSRTCANIQNWATCLHDADCASGVCGCNGGPLPMVCLPSDLYSRSCL